MIWADFTAGKSLKLSIFTNNRPTILINALFEPCRMKAKRTCGLSTAHAHLSTCLSRDSQNQFAPSTHEKSKFTFLNAKHTTWDSLGFLMGSLTQVFLIALSQVWDWSTRCLQCQVNTCTRWWASSALGFKDGWGSTPTPAIRFGILLSWTWWGVRTWCRLRITQSTWCSAPSMGGLWSVIFLIFRIFYILFTRLQRWHWQISLSWPDLIHCLEFPLIKIYSENAERKRSFETHL